MRWRSSTQSLLLSLSDPKSLPQISQLHHQLLIRGLFSPYFATKLLQLYADAGDLAAARHLFDRLPAPNVFAYTALAALLSRLADHRECLHLYRRMRREGVTPDAYVLPVALRSAPLAALHADALKFGADSAPHVRSALVSAYARLGDASAAQKVFDDAPTRDLLAYNALLSAYVTTGSIDAAAELVGSMASDGCEPDTVSWNIMMDGYCRAGRCHEALEIFNARLPCPNVVSWTTLIVGYARRGNHEAALATFRRMVSESSVPPDQDTLSCVISSCRYLGAYVSAREVHSYGLKNIVTPDAFYGSAGAALVVMYSSCGKILAAERVFRVMDPTDVVTWNAVLHAFTHSGMCHVALHYFRYMQLRGIRSEAATLAALLPACELKHGKQIHAYVVRHNYYNATAVYNALMDVYSKFGCIQTAHLVFLTMGARDIVSWNTMIRGLGSHGLGIEAIELLGQMVELESQPDGITLTCVLMACSHSGLVEEGLELFEKLTSGLGLVPTMEQNACVVDMLARAGRFDAAVGFIRRMAGSPDAAVWGSILAASRAHHKVEFGKLAFEGLVQLEPKNAGNYVTMSNIYWRAGRWEEAKVVRKMMEKRGLVKPSGYSWIEAQEELAVT